MTTTVKRNEYLFPLGSVYVTRGAKETTSLEEIMSLISRHASGDWGLLGEEDWEANEQALIHGMRLLSAYKTREGRRVWIITESDRLSTTFLLPEEY